MTPYEDMTDADVLAELGLDEDAETIDTALGGWF